MFLTLGLEDAYPHNQPVEVITELGLVGFAMYAGMLLLAVKYAIEIFRGSAGSTDRRSSVAILIGLALFGFLLTLKQGTVHNSGVDMMIYIVITRIALYERDAALVGDDEEAYDEEYDEEHDGEYDESHEDEEFFDDDNPEAAVSY